MNHKRVLTLTIILFTSLSALNAQDSNVHRQIHKGDKSRQTEDLQRKLDSLQKAYDSLYVATRKQAESPAKTHKSKAKGKSDSHNVTYNAESIDSLLNAYYMQNSLNINDFDFISIDRDTLTSSIPDSVYIERLNKLNSFIPIQFNQSVKNCIIRYTDKIPGATRKIISLAPYYLPQFEEIFDEYGIPTELKAMAVIESAFNPRAVSRAKAKGMWQFMYATARQYGLTINSYVDERMDPIKSCRAAAQYLKDSYKVFGDWSLAIASYNCGLGNVRKAINRSGGKTNFWDIYQYLPRETRGYVPVFIAALYILEYYPEHGFKPIPVSLPSAVDTFHISQNLYFKQITDNIDIPLDLLRDLNPQYLHDMVPGAEREYVLRLPYSYGKAFVDKEEDIFRSIDTVAVDSTAVTIAENQEPGKEAEPAKPVYHTVRKGETLAAIASKYHTTVVDIKKWNNLGSNTIRTGQSLAIYGEAANGDTSYKPAPSKPKSSGGYVMYTVRKGDSLSSIAKRHGVSLNTLLKLNNMKTSSKIYPGMKIRVKKA